MAPSLLLHFLFYLSLLFLPYFVRADDSDATAFVYAGCSQQKYSPGTPYELNADSVLTSIATASGVGYYANFNSSSAGGVAGSEISPPVTGLYQCRIDLAIPDCQSCVRSALSHLGALCTDACGGALQLRGCFIRYGNDTFLGHPDNTLLYKRCGPSPGGSDSIYVSSDVATARDTALDALSGSTSAGGYKFGGGGDMKAEAQCVGDITGKDCENCIGNAIDQLRGGCGFAVSGEVYLGKCYARYWSNKKYYTHASNGKGSSVHPWWTCTIALSLLIL